MSVLPVASALWNQVDDALADVPAMGAVIGRLTAELAETRMDRANLLAAMRATIAAAGGRGTRPPVLPPRRTGRPPGALPGPRGAS